MQMAGDLIETPTGRHAEALQDLARIRSTVERMRDDLLDFNPLLAVMAESLQKALELELESRRCDVLQNDLA